MLSIVWYGFLMTVMFFGFLYSKIRVEADDIKKDEVEEAQVIEEVKEERTKYCYHCGVKISPKANFCNNCGKKIN